MEHPLFLRGAGSTAILLMALTLPPARVSAQPCPDPKGTDFKREVLTPLGTLKEPIELAVAGDGRVFVVERAGDIKLHDPATGQTTVAATLDVYLHTGSYDVGGILGVAVGPDFLKDNWVYVYYAPRSLWNGTASREAGKLTYRLSRFKLVNKLIDKPSEQVFLEVPSEWETHNGGSLKFGKGGDLFLSTGDNSCASCSAQYSPMDERVGWHFSDGQRSTANTNDLRGKVLRIHPEASKTGDRHYTIPAGNLFLEGMAKTRPEIYTMGHRNPYRIFPDPVTGRLYIGEFGPAAAIASERGPAGADQVKVADQAAFLGYPYFLKDNQPYCHWDYAAGKCIAIKNQAGLNYDPLRPINTSPNNTGLEVLPPAKAAVLWEHDGSSPDPIAGLKTCGFGAGPVYRYDSTLDSKIKFPPSFNDQWFFFGIMAGGWKIKQTPVQKGPVGPITTASTPLWYGVNGITFANGIHDMEFGADGALYIVDYGTASYARNGDAALYRVAYTGCLPPVAPASRIAQGRDAALVSPGALRAGSIAIPAGARSADIYDLSGRVVWSALADGRSSSRLTLPNFMGRGMYRIRWR